MKKSLLLAAALTGTFAWQSSQAATLVIANGDFSGGAAGGTLDPNSWTTQDSDPANGIYAFASGGAISGTQGTVLHLKDGSGSNTTQYIQQTITGTNNPGVFAQTYSSYTLTLDLGWRSDCTPSLAATGDATYRFSLINVTDNVELAFIDYTFTARTPVQYNTYSINQNDASFVLNYDNTIASYAGDSIAIRIARTDADTTATDNGDSTAWIDDVRLAAVPEPSVALLGGFGLLGLLRRRRAV